MKTAEKKNWWSHDATPGVLLIVATITSFALQNSPAHEAFDALLRQPVGAQLGPFRLRVDLLHFVADGLMAIFFLVVGLELKRKTLEGPFQNKREAALPLIAALGGMALPALIFLALTAPFSLNYVRGWAIPAATDIAFAVGLLAVFGQRIPEKLRLFLLALAVADDLGAILIIAIFYTSTIVGWALGGAVACFLAMLALNRVGVSRLGLYWILAFVMWSFMLASGVHATVAGVLAAIAFPMRAPNGASPLIAAEDELRPWVLLGIMPAFALVYAGAPLKGLDLSVLAHPVALGAMLGLAIGKPVGIVGGACMGARLLKRELPADFSALSGVAMLAGVGFTMSLFLSGLAFGEGELAIPSKLGVLAGSAVSALLGMAMLARALARRAAR
ncbi:MAG: Na+/H+ antiporter NhaA [Hyphomonadaceae bacterium]